MPNPGSAILSYSVISSQLQRKFSLLLPQFTANSEKFYTKAYCRASVKDKAAQLRNAAGDLTIPVTEVMRPARSRASAKNEPVKISGCAFG